MANARHLDPSVMRLAFALLVLGYGTKVGLAPMHSWLPDAHSQAPAPISALMSGVLLTVAFYAILRFKAVVDLAVGPGFARGLLVIVALLSLAVAASLLLTQRDYKRMLAYSSLEHMGLIALGAAAGIPLAIAAVLLHILGHGLAKSVLFLTSGEIMAVEGTSQINGVRALLARRPALGGVFGIGLVALLGLPPFGVFSSELLMARAEFEVGLGWAAVAAIVAMMVIFVAVVGQARHMLLGPPGTAAVEAPSPGWVAAPLVGGLGDLWLHRRVRLAAVRVARGGGPRGGHMNLPATLSEALRPVGHHRVAATVQYGDLVDVAASLFADGMRLALVSGHDDGVSMRAVYLFTGGPPDSRVELHVPVDRSRPQVPSLAGLSFPASRFERELSDLFGIEPVDHPQPRRLVLHQHWPEGWHPMRHGSGDVPPMVVDAGSFPFIPVEGTGVYEIPVGPVHAGLIEPGHFRFWVVGETILRMKARLWFVHKGIERLCQGKDVGSGLEIAERISGDTAVGHGLAYCLAVEDAQGCWSLRALRSCAVRCWSSSVCTTTLPTSVPSATTSGSGSPKLGRSPCESSSCASTGPSPATASCGAASFREAPGCSICPPRPNWARSVNGSRSWSSSSCRAPSSWSGSRGRRSLTRSTLRTSGSSVSLAALLACPLTPGSPIPSPTSGMPSSPPCSQVETRWHDSVSAWTRSGPHCRSWATSSGASMPSIWSPGSRTAAVGSLPREGWALPRDGGGLSCTGWSSTMKTGWSGSRWSIRPSSTGRLFRCA